MLSGDKTEKNLAEGKQLSGCSYPGFPRTIPGTGVDGSKRVEFSRTCGAYYVWAGDICIVYCADGSPGTESWRCGGKNEWVLASDPLVCGTGNFKSLFVIFPGNSMQY